MPKKQGKRPSGKYIKEPPRRVMRIIERMGEVLDATSPDKVKGRKVDFAVGSEEDECELKLPVLARNQLRRELRSHPEARRHVAGLKDTIDQLSKPELLALAEKFGIDIKAIIDHSLDHGKGLESVLESEELERWEHNHKNPAFVGSLEFDISFTLLGRRAKRRAKAEYSFTPHWPYFDLSKKGPFEGWPGSLISLHVLTALAPDPEDDPELEAPHWVQLDEFIGEDIMPPELWDRIREAIDDKCRVEDAKRRQAAGSKAKPRA